MSHADRRELSEPLADAAVDWARAAGGPVGARVRAVCGTNELRALFEVRTQRRRFAVRRTGEAEADAQAEIALDECVLSHPDGEPAARLQRVELEALTPDPAALRALVAALRDRCVLRAAVENKFALGLRTAGLVPVTAPQFAPAAVTAGMTAAEIALANLRRHVSAWHVHEPGARLGDEPEVLHQLRVAVRRVDAVVRDFHDALPLPRHLRPVLKRVLRVLGEVRDLDIALGELAAFGRDLEPAERQHLEPLVQLLSGERARARAAMTRVLDSPAVRDELQALTALLLAPPAVARPDPADAGVGAAPADPREPAAAPVPGRRAAPPLLRRRYRQVRKAADHLHEDASAAAHHALRGQVKKLRYALEAVAPLYGKPAERLLRSLCRWQERLGVQHDAALAAQRLQALAAAPPQGILPPTVFLMGRLAAHHERVAARARGSQDRRRRRLRDRWKRLRSAFTEE